MRECQHGVEKSTHQFAKASAGNALAPTFRVIDAQAASMLAALETSLQGPVHGVNWSSIVPEQLHALKSVLEQAEAFSSRAPAKADPPPGGAPGATTAAPPPQQTLPNPFLIGPPLQPGMQQQVVHPAMQGA